MSVSLYCLTCETTGQLYVGIAESVQRRWRQHIYLATKPRCRLHFAIDRFGSSDFSVDELHVYDTREQAEAAEGCVVAILDLCNSGLNTIPGGGTPPSAKGKKQTPEHVARRAASMRGRFVSEETRLRLSKALAGRPRAAPLSPDHVAKLVAANRRRKGVWKRGPFSQEHRDRISASVAAFHRHKNTQELHVGP